MFRGNNNPTDLFLHLGQSRLGKLGAAAGAAGGRGRTSAMGGCAQQRVVEGRVGDRLGGQELLEVGLVADLGQEEDERVQFAAVAALQHIVLLGELLGPFGVLADLSLGLVHWHMESHKQNVE